MKTLIIYAHPKRQELQCLYTRDSQGEFIV